MEVRTGSEIVFSNVRPYLVGHFATEPHFVAIKAGKIVEISREFPKMVSATAIVIEGNGQYLTPGFWDLQLNGLEGIDLLSATSHGVEVFLRHCLEYGITVVFPTVITDSPERMAATIEAISQARDGEYQARIGGIHIEGPMISSGHGKGCHPAAHIRQLSWEEYRHWQEISGGKIAIITLAPEAEGALDLIPRLVGDGIVVGIGHTDASKEIITEAIRQGAKLATHLWNACKKELERNLEHVGAMLMSDRLYASFIADGHHIHPDTLAISFRVKPLDKIILVTDAMAGAGAPDGQYRLGDLEVSVIDGVARDPNNLAQLAGSTLTLVQAIVRAIKFGQIPLDRAIRMVTNNPATLLGRAEEAQIKEGAPADLVLFSYQDEKLEIRKVMRNGQLSFLRQLTR